MSDANDTFAANAKALSDLAAQVLAYRRAGDFAAADKAKAQYDALLGRLAPDQKRLATIALADDMPSDFELWLLQVQHWLKLAPGLALIVAVAVVGFVVYRKASK